MPAIPIEVSARHVHLTAPDWATLFGETKISEKNTISQPPQFIAIQRLILRGPKGELQNVGIVGPFRKVTQVELAMTDARRLGIKPPISDSGILDKAVTVTIVGPQGEISRAAAIIPRRHIHINPADAAAAGLHDRQIVSVQIDGIRGARLHNVTVRVHPDFNGRLHLDTDEGNASGVHDGMLAEIIL